MVKTNSKEKFVVEGASMKTLVMFRSAQRAGWSFLGVLALAFAPAAFAQNYSITPSAVAFKQVSVGTVGLAYTITVQNTGKTGNVVINSYSVTPSEFQFFYGWSPVVLPPGQLINYSLRFAPDAAETFNGTFTINIQGVTNPIVVPLSGTGVATNAKGSVTPSALNFSVKGPGGASTAQAVTVTNVGTTGTTVNSVTIDPPFQVNGFTAAKVLQPGKSLSLNVELVGTFAGTHTSVLTIGYSNLNAQGTDITGTVGTGVALGINLFPTLPSATQGSTYLANLTAVGGIPPYTWSLATGSTLPSGLSLSSTGAITGTVASTVALGSYTFSATATTSNSKSVTKKFTLPVLAQTGAKCNNIVSYVTGTTTPLVALNDLGTGTYEGSEGGLYPNGSNVRPAAFDAAGVAIAESIQPLDADGTVDTVNGKIGVMTVGMSALFDTFLQFITDFYADPSVNPHIVLVPGAQPRAYAANFANPTDGFWNPIFQNFLPAAGLTPAQVQVVYIKDIDPSPTGTFPADRLQLQAEYESIVQNVYAKFPNVKIAYFGGPIYTGYSNGLNTIDPEPYEYESAFAVKWAIQDQINGNANLNWDSSLGPVMAPWMSWGAYPWANGLMARSDGTTWACNDIKYDGFHPSELYGREKETNLMLNFFKSDDTSTPWFLAH
jgi:hypothetical protein